jgi:hypothetical protein
MAEVVEVVVDFSIFGLVGGFVPPSNFGFPEHAKLNTGGGCGKNC